MRGVTFTLVQDTGWLNPACRLGEASRELCARDTAASVLRTCFYSDTHFAPVNQLAGMLVEPRIRSNRDFSRIAAE